MSESLITIFWLQEEVVFETDSASDSTSTQATTSSTDSGFIQFPNKEINKRVAIASTLGALGFLLFTRLEFGVSLKDLTALALPYEEVFFFSIIIILIFVLA